MAALLYPWLYVASLQKTIHDDNDNDNDEDEVLVPPESQHSPYRVDLLRPLPQKSSRTIHRIKNVYRVSFGLLL